jgi:RimJ/RimL family protein N-acetyltransferase
MIGMDIDETLMLPRNTVRFRRSEMADATGILDAVRSSVPELEVWMPWAHAGYSLEDTTTWLELCRDGWEKATQYSFIAVDVTSGEVLADCSISQINRMHGFANLGYWVRSSATRQGLGSALARRVAQFGVEEIRLNRLEILTAVGNVASQRVAQKAGATLEGVLRSRLIFREEVIDAALFSLTARDFGKEPS